MSQVNQSIGAARGVTLKRTQPSSTSEYGTPLAIVFGTFRVAPTIILSGIQLIACGYGGGISVETVQLALCEGEIAGVLAYWREKVKTTGTGGVTIATGTLPQAPWSSLTGALAPFALGYGGVATGSCLTGHQTVSTGELERTTYEVVGFNADWQDGSSTAYDALPALVIAHILESPVYGLGWPAGLIDAHLSLPFRLGADGTSASGYAAYCQANNWFISMAISEQRVTRAILEEVLTATDSVALWSEGKLKVRPLGEAEVVGSVTYTPYMTPIYDLGASAPGADFIASDGEPLVTMERARRADTYNCFPVEFSNRFPARKDTTGATISEPFNAYNAWTEDGVPDPVDVDRVGLRKAGVTSLRCITREAHARDISSILARRALYTERNSYRFRLGWRFSLLEPADLVTITDADLGLNRRLVRIVSIEEDEKGIFEVTALEVGTISSAAAAAYSMAA